MYIVLKNNEHSTKQKGQISLVYEENKQTIKHFYTLHLLFKM